MRSSRLPTQHPVEGVDTGSGFGWRVDPITGQSALHSGLDFPADTGTPILAAAGGGTSALPVDSRPSPATPPPQLAPAPAATALPAVAAANRVTVAQLRERLARDGTDFDRFRANLRDQILVKHRQ